MPSQSEMGITKLISTASLLVACLSGGLYLSANGQPNNFFGAMPGGGANQVNSSQTGNSTKEDDGAAGPGIPLTNGAMPPPPPAGADYTADEKRMQKKYRGNLKHAQSLISQGEALMKSGDKNSKEYKRGKILKEVGEKSFADLKAANPYDDSKEKPIYDERKRVK